MGQISGHDAAGRHRPAAGRCLYETLKSQIMDASYAGRARLPSTRALATELGLSRTTVTAVYEQLAAEGYLETSSRNRARVTAGAATLKARSSRPVVQSGRVSPVVFLRLRAEVLQCPLCGILLLGQ
jgi:DNA-binding transcriptional MocR family regulator